MWFGVVSLFPEMFSALNSGITGRALETGLITITYWNPRDYAHNKHRRVDDSPYGGGPGMVMQVQPLRDAIQAAKVAAPNPNEVSIIYLSPQGKRFDQIIAKKIVQQQHDSNKQTTRKSFIFVAGRYEGIDERVMMLEPGEEWSIGDYILSGGELAIMVVIDAMTRLLPGALGHAASADQDSISTGLLEYPHYTRPPCVDGIKVPDILLTGDHQAIAQWRNKESLKRTLQKRPDLLEKKTLTKQERLFVTELIHEQNITKEIKN